MPLDVLKHTDPLLGGGGVIVRPQEPEARDALLIHVAVYVGGDRVVPSSCHVHRVADDTVTTRLSGADRPVRLRACRADHGPTTTLLVEDLR